MSMSKLKKFTRNTVRNLETVSEATRIQNLQVLGSLLKPALRGFILQKGKEGSSAAIRSQFDTTFNWDYQPRDNEFNKLYQKAKLSQWNVQTDLDWSIPVNIDDPSVDLISEEIFPLNQLRTYRRLPRKQQRKHRAELMAWLLSQFLHGEQGALFATCHLTSAYQPMEGKLFGSTQVVDEGRHVEAFQTYLTTKLNRVYEINDNLYVILDALMTDSRWDLKFLGMQILIEGLALGAFGTLRQFCGEPLLRQMLKYIITDEARHVHFGVLALQEYYTNELSEKERREREDWSFEMAILLRNRFLAHEFYDEYYAHNIGIQEWNRVILNSQFMNHFRDSMFRRIVPNLKRINLLSDRIKRHYEDLGILGYEREKAAPELTLQEMLLPTHI